MAAKFRVLKSRVLVTVNRALMASALMTPIVLAASLSRATTAHAVEPGIPEQLVTEADALAITIRQKAGDMQAAVGTSERDDRVALAKFYLDRGGKPVWTQEKGFLGRAGEVMAEIGHAGDWGLEAQAFELPSASPQPTHTALADAEIKLSLAVLKYARHARGGRFNPSELTKNLDVTAQLYDPRSVIVAMAETDGPAAYLRRLHPKHPQFEKLRQVYLQLRGRGTGSGPSLAAGIREAEAPQSSSGGLTIPPGPRLRRGQSHPHVALLRQRLGIPPEREAAFFDDQLADAVEDFQHQNGLRPDGTLDHALRAALNASAPPASGRTAAAARQGSERAAGGQASAQALRVLANMERWRYVPEDMGRLHVWVNVPEYTVRVVRDGQVIHSERIVAGKTDTQTAIFSASMQEVIFNPHWNVPLSIKVQEIQPSLSRSPAILQKQNLRIKVGNRDIDPGSVDWGNADMRNYHFYQPSGGQNVLGIVKFAFPNKHDIYMHDTPSKSLFNQEVRAYSHGCMRVRDPRKLAEVLLREDKGWDSAKIGQALAANPGEENHIPLSKRIPVHVTYFTTFVDDAGKLATRNDIYGHDTRVADALSGKPIAQIAESDPAAVQARLVQQAQANAPAQGSQGQASQAQGTQRRAQAQRRREHDDSGPGGIFSWMMN